MLFILKVVIGFFAGVFLAFILNAKLNFKVPKSRNTRTFIIFLIIAIVALILNLILIRILKNRVFLSYSSLRFITAALIFMLSYTAHRKITFDFVKKVGIAVYLNESESLSKIYSKVRYYADFIHLDLIDKSLDKNASEVDISLISEVDKTWGLKKMLHIMSKKPSSWVKKLNKSVNVIIFHLEIDEPIEEIIKLCKKYNKKIGLALNTSSKVEDIIKYLPDLDFVQIMGINNLGKTGQLFNPNSLEKLNKLNKLNKKYNFQIIFDGGVKATNIWRINAKYIVSSSGLLLSKDPVKSFMELKTSSRYQSIEQQFRKDILKEIKSVINSIDFIKSGNFVGTFSEEKGIKGISDTDIVIIIDKLTKNKYQKILSKFEALGKRLQSNYAYNVLINPSFGPLKFDINSLVLHLMIYDKESHKFHCINSPFTCFDWQRTNLFFKEHLSKIYKVRGLQPNYFFNFRRSALEYLSEIQENKISYRVYNFKNNKVFEEKKYKEMDSRHRIEFSYHIFRFLISNFLKLYYKKNKCYSFNEMLNKYFKIFPKNKKKHKKIIKKIHLRKETKNFKEYPNLINKLGFFIKDFESQFRNYFYLGATEIYFLRHFKTKLNKKNQFIGQKLDPNIIKPNKKIIKKIKENLKEIDFVFSSPLKRCKNTLKLIIDKDTLIDNRLKEINYGDIEGRDLKYLSSKYPQIIKSWKKGEDPRFPNGENSLEVITRVKKFIRDIKKYKNKKILVCTHNVILRSVIGSYLKIPVKNWIKINIPHAEPIKFILPKNNQLYIELTNSQIKEIFKNF